MKKINIRNVILVCLFCIEILSSFLTMKSFSNKPIEEMKEINEINKKQFSMFISDEEGNYTEYTESNVFPEGYQINLENSKCIDTKGNVIDGILSGNGTNITVTSTKTSYCYLYFDIEELTAVDYLVKNISSDVLWDSTLEDDGYRYVGENPANYVCFGYNDASEDCDFTSATNTDLYAYRIIGIFEDEEGIQHLKLIKKEIIDVKRDDEYGYMWNEDYLNDVDWRISDLYIKLNGNIFLNNTIYIPTGWSDKIETWKWTATNTQTYYKYDLSSESLVSNVGTRYYSSWPIGIYNSEHEVDTTIGCYRSGSGSAKNCKTTASYTYSEAKIGLMYASDYALSLGETAAIMSGSIYTNRTTLKTGWMHISNNDSDAYDYEWTMSRSGASSDGEGGNCYYALAVYSDGDVDDNGVEGTLSVRPVFYLKSDVELTGEGTTTNPYIVS